MARVVVVTGLSGAGRSSALRILEDLGFEAVDNLPLPLLPRLLGDPETLERDLAVGVDSRSRAFDPRKLLEELARHRDRRSEGPELLFLEADEETLLRRYSETRRRHPLARERPVSDGIAREREIMAPLRAEADFVLDTSRLSLPGLRRLLAVRYGRSAAPTLTLLSFAYRNGLPREADLVFDVRFLRNPHYVPELRARTGRDPEVAAYIRQDERYAAFEARLRELLLLLLPAYRSEGKSHLTVAIGCTGGRHRSVFVAERLAHLLRDLDWRVIVAHRDAQHSPQQFEVASR